MQRKENIEADARYTFKTYERLKRRKHIDTLFSLGKAYSVFPVTIKYLLVEREAGEPSTLKAGFSVSKKKFKHAVDRNRIKRLLREVWRLNKHLLSNTPVTHQLHLFLIYTDKELPKYETIEASVLKCIGKLQNVVAGNA
jgi:ribonuclease P protein component